MLDAKGLRGEDRRFFLQRLQELERRVDLTKPQTAIKKAIFMHGRKQLFCRKGRKGGGTFALLYPAARICGASKGKYAHLIYTDLVAAKQILHQMDTLKYYFPEEWEIQYKWTDKDKYVYFPLSDSKLFVLGAHQEEKMQGFKSDYVAFDEFADHNPMAYEICRPNMAARGGVMLVNGAPPLTAHNHYIKLENYAKANPDKWFYIKWNLYDNPHIAWTPEEIEQQKQEYYARGQEHIWEIQYLANDYKSSDYNVLKAFEKKHNCVHLPEYSHLLRDPKNQYFCVLDPGYRKCFAAIFAVFNPKSNTIFIIDEIYAQDKNLQSAKAIWQTREDIIRKHGLEDVRWKNIYDCAALSFAVEVNALAGNRVHPPIMIPCVKHKDDEDTYFGQINQLFKENRILIGHRCSSTIFEVENYITDDAGRYPDEHNHILDCMRYLVKFLSSELRLDMQDSFQHTNHQDDYRKTNKNKPIEEWDEWPFL